MPKADSSPATSALAQPYAQFGFDVLRQLESQRPDANVFISPTSIAVALAMTSNGASGTTRDAILRTLHAETQPIEAFNAANRELAEQISKTTAVQLSMANALWLQQGLPVNPAFQQVLQTAYERTGRERGVSKSCCGRNDQRLGRETYQRPHRASRRPGRSLDRRHAHQRHRLQGQVDAPVRSQVDTAARFQTCEWRRAPGPNDEELRRIRLLCRREGAGGDSPALCRPHLCNVCCVAAG